MNPLLQTRTEDRARTLVHIPTEHLKQYSPDWSVLMQAGITVRPDGSAFVDESQRRLLDLFLSVYGAASTEVVA